MRFLIVGAGATGVALGTALKCDGNDVSFVDLPGEVAALAGQSFVLERDGTRLELAAPALSVGASGLFDYVLLCVRLHEVEAALPTLRDHLAHDAAVVTLQPGTVAAMRAAEVLGSATVLPASLDATLALKAPGHAQMVSDSVAVTVGEAAPTDSWRVEVLDAALSSAGVNCRTLPGPAGDPDAQPPKIDAGAPILQALDAALAGDLARIAGDGETAATLDIATGIRPDIVTAAVGAGALPASLAAFAALPLPARSPAHGALPGIQLAASWIRGSAVRRD